MADEPLISIILPVHNGSKYLAKAIQSCLDQTYTNLELIVVDDASTDDSLLIAQTCKSRDNRIRIISNEKNLALPASLNIGHKHAKGNFITWTSDDNLYQKDALRNLYRIMVDKDVDIVYSDYLIMDEDGTLVREARLKDIEYLLLYGVIGTCFLYTKAVYTRNKGYDENLFLVEDYDFWLRALKHSKFLRIKNPGFYYYRQHKDSLTGRMTMDPYLKKQCLENLKKSYSKLFKDCNLNNKGEFIDVLIKRGVEGPHNNIEAVRSKYFFKDLETVSNMFKEFSYYKIKRIFLEDALETILKNKKYHTLSVFIALHRAGKREILRLPIERYLALTKKCLF
jgi:glycosyltransferase involved in cell wall biosynthesis